MQTSLFHYEFPKELVAQHPLPRRDESRMMVVDRRSGQWEHKNFYEISSYLREGDLLVLNNAEADLIELNGRKVPALPPYIKRKKPEDFTEQDYQRYRTVYAKIPGSKAAPTAGFHFTTEILDQLKTKGVQTQTLTLHVSYDTYKPIRSERIEDHPMHGEEFVIPEETADAVRQAKKEKRRVVAVGTTVVRALESSTSPTTLFIQPGFQFQIVDALLTNFHRPRSTVLVMVSAFADRELILSAYEEAIRERYRLFSYGDCMLII
ncbi:MAG: S-adenosylmethionine:tRNA ribosyltransferase-isomerase [Deltaproteobacteria bacterium]|nr:S-adenosylmethionine:tRNA ribosyltransferase-isomerase [Deltaproteobacteria bacterium]